MHFIAQAGMHEEWVGRKEYGYLIMIHQDPRRALFRCPRLLHHRSPAADTNMIDIQLLPQQEL